MTPQFSQPHLFMTTSHLALGNQALKAKDFERALQHYRAAQAAQPALAHLLKANIELVERRLRASAAKGEAQAPAASTTIDVVVPVFNALEDVKRCLASLEQHTDGLRVRVIVVNDGSDADTTQWLRTQCQGKPLFTLIEHPQNQGYTRAVNTGLRASTAEFVITQNSDTIVTPGWLQGMVRCMAADPKIGVVGPLSNAASWQNVPQLRDASGNFAVNDLPQGMSPDAMAALVARVSQRRYPRLPFVNGFCFMIRRAVIDAIGYMDEENFPVGYGEENDFCIRAIDAGFELAIADDVFVFHAKSKSFGHERRKTLSEQGTRSLKHKHTPEKYAARVEAVKRTEALDAVRARIQSALAEQSSADTVDLMSMRVLFLLPVKGGGGGAHSVVQEVTEMRRLGIHARVAVKHEQVEGFLKSYADIPGAENTFVGFDDHSLIDLAEDYDVVVGTIFTSMKLVKRIVEVSPHILPAYYVQDYEPMFFEEGSPQWHEARESYTLVPGAFLFAKTHWIIDEVKRHHGVTVHKVQPSIDHEVYKPAQRVKDGRLHVTAMIRPQTPRRGAARTMRLFARLHQAFGDRIQFHTFGCESDHPEFLKLERNFPFQNHGPLLRPQVAALLAQSDLFVDLSDYQAFGRTGLEAMACGCAAVVPAAGGANEYAIQEQTALVVDSTNEYEAQNLITRLLSDTALLFSIKRNGLKTAAGYSVHLAAISECISIERALNTRRVAHPKKEKPRLYLLPRRNADGSLSHEGYQRVVLPYQSTSIRSHFRTILGSSLPTTSEAEIVVIQHGASETSSPQFNAWAREWKKCGGRFIYEADETSTSEILNAIAAIAAATNNPPRADLQPLMAADLIHTTSDSLIESLRSINKNARKLHSFIDIEMWLLNGHRNHSDGPYKRQTQHLAKIGYIGEPSDAAKLNFLAEIMAPKNREKTGNIEIEIIGTYQSKSAPFGTRVGLPKNTAYPNYVRWLMQRVHWEIGLLPVSTPTEVSDKDLTRILQYLALGMPVITNAKPSNQIPESLSRSIIHIDGSIDSWIATIKELISNREKAEKLERHGREAALMTCKTISNQIADSLISLTKKPENHHSSGTKGTNMEKISK